MENLLFGERMQIKDGNTMRVALMLSAEKSIGAKEKIFETRAAD